MPFEIKSYLKWKGDSKADALEVEIVQEKSSDLTISDADSDVIFDEEKKILMMPEYLQMKKLALKSAQDFLTLYMAIPDKNKSCLPARTTILECRQQGFAQLEKQADFLNNKVYRGSYDEEWSLRKVLRRFIWHDRIHSKAMYRMAVKTFGLQSVPNVFHFDL